MLKSYTACLSECVCQHFTSLFSFIRVFLAPDLNNGWFGKAPVATVTAGRHLTLQQTCFCFVRNTAEGAKCCRVFFFPSSHSAAKQTWLISVTAGGGEVGYLEKKLNSCNSSSQASLKLLLPVPSACWEAERRLVWEPTPVFVFSVTDLQIKEQKHISNLFIIELV